MRRFHFSMQPALQLREQQEEIAFARLAEAQADLFAAHEQVERLNASIAKLLSSSLTFNTFDLNATITRQVYLERLEAKLSQADWAVLQAQDAVAVATEKAAKAKSEREALTRLRERQYAEWEDEMRLSEQKELNEIAISRHRRKSSTPDQS